jgi:hypothetical protein
LSNEHGGKVLFRSFCDQILSFMVRKSMRKEGESNTLKVATTTLITFSFTAPWATSVSNGMTSYVLKLRLLSHTKQLVRRKRTCLCAAQWSLQRTTARNKRQPDNSFADLDSVSKYRLNCGHPLTGGSKTEYTSLNVPCNETRCDIDGLTAVMTR